jgi:hypothetical protein
MRLLLGFDALREYLASYAIAIDPATGLPSRYARGVSPRGPSLMGVSACGIDFKYKTTQVLDACRQSQWSGLVSHVSSGVVIMRPVGFEMPAGRAAPAIAKETTDPARPHLGPMTRWHLYRHGWVDRALLRIGGGDDTPDDERRLMVVCDTPGDFTGHWTSQVLRPKHKQHAMEVEELEWDKPKSGGFRDDWLMAFVYAEAIAALECRLDRFGEELLGETNPRAAAVLTPTPQAGGGLAGGGGGGFQRGYGGGGVPRGRGG